MNRNIRSGALASLAVCAAVGVAAAQTPQSSDTSTSAPKSITVTGCVQQAAKSATGTSGTAGTPAEPAESTTMAGEAKFVLTNTMASASASSTAGTAGTSDSASVASEYRLTGDDAKLSPHVGHKVEITGTPAKSMSGAPSSGASAPKLKVESVKMVSATCP
jgi:hypothetical protein